MAVTDWGRVVRLIRLNRGELLIDMAKKFGASPSLFSAWESGKKDVPVWVCRELKGHYTLTAEEEELYDKAIYGEPIDDRQIEAMTARYRSPAEAMEVFNEARGEGNGKEVKR